MASGWPRVRGASREVENGPDFRGCTGSDGRRDMDGSWHIGENSFPGSWTSKSSKREHDGAPAWGGHLIGRGDTADRTSSDKPGGRTADRNGYVDRRGSRWNDGDCNRNGSSKSSNRNGHFHRPDPNFRRVVDDRVHDERDRFGPNGIDRDSRQRRGWEGNRRQGRSWDRAGPSRDSAGFYPRPSSSSRSAEQHRPSSEVVRSASTALDHPVCDDIGRGTSDVAARNSVLKDNSSRSGVLHISVEVSSAGNRNVGVETAVEEGNKPVFGKRDLHAATENARNSSLVCENHSAGDLRTTVGAGLENCRGANLITHMELSVLQDSAVRSPIPMSWNIHSEVQVNGTPSSPAGWFYIDRDGVTQGPFRLAELKRQSRIHELMLDHLVRRSGTNEWVTLEHARSPSDSQSVLGESASAGHYLFGLEQQVQTVGSTHAVREDEKLSSGVGGALTSGKPGTQMQTESSVTAGYTEIDYQIDARVEALMRGFPLALGKEKETVFAALSTASQRWHNDNEMESVIEESPRSHIGYTDYGDQWKDSEFDSEVLGMNPFNGDGQTVDEQVNKPTAVTDKQPEKVMPPLAPAVKEGKCPPEGVHSWNWPSGGGDWKLVFSSQLETSGSLEKGAPKKLVINGGRSLCEIVKSGLPDPRTLCQGTAPLETSTNQKLELPQWAIKVWEKKQLAGQKPVVVVDDQTVLGQSSHTTSQVPAKSKPQIPTPVAQRTTPKRGLSTPLKASAAVAAGGLKSIKAGKTPPSRGASVAVPKVTAPEKALDHCGSLKGPGKNGFLERAVSSSVGGDIENAADDHTGKRKFVAGHLDEARVEKMQKVQLDEGRQSWPVTPRPEVHEREQRGSETLERLKTPLSHRTAEDVYSPSEPLPPAVYEEREVKSGDWASGSKNEDPSEFHRRDPQFITYTGGKLHEYVMKAYRAHIFAAALTEGLDSWLLRKQSETVAGTSYTCASPQLCAYPSSAPAASPSTSHHSQAIRKSHDSVLPVESVKRTVGDSQSCSVFGESGMVHAATHKDSHSGAFEDPMHHEVAKRPNTRETKQVTDHNLQQHSYRRRLIHADSSDDEDTLQDTVEKANLHGLDQHEWKQTAVDDLDNLKACEIDCHLLMQPEILLKVFRCLNGNIRDLLAASRTCKTWKLVVEKWKAEATCVDLSSLGELCTEKTISSLVGYGGGKLKQVILKGCSSVTPDSLEHLLQRYPSIALVDISGCAQLMNIAKKGLFRVKWVGCNGDLSLYRKREGPHGRTKSLKMISEKRASLSQTSDEHSMHSSEYNSSKTKAFDDSTTSASMPAHMTPLGPDRDSADLSLDSSFDVRKRLKLTNGGKVSGGKHGTAKTVKYENGDDTKSYHSLLHEDKRARAIPKQLSSSSLPRTSEKLISPRKKLEKICKSPATNLTDGERALEKAISSMVKKIKEADTKKFFYRALPDDKSGGVGMDISTLEKKLKEGAYSGSKGWDTIKEDIRSLTKQGLREAKGSPKNLAAQAILRVQREVEGLLAPFAEPHQKAALTVKRSGSSDSKKRKRAREDVSKRTGTTKKLKDEEGTESDRSHDRDTKRATKLKKTRWSEPEAESSEEDVEDEGLFEDEGEETETDDTGSEMSSHSEGDDVSGDENDFSDYDGRRPEGGTRDWGARMTKSGMVPPVTRKYEVIEEYKVVEDHERVKQKMTVELPEDYEQKVQAAQQKRGAEYAHLDIPEVKECQPPRKKLGAEVVEQEVYGIDPYTHNLLLDTMPEDTEDFAEIQKQQFIEETLLWTLNKDVSHFTDTGKAPMEYPLDTIVDRILEEARAAKNHRLVDFCAGLLRNMKVRQSKEKAETRDRYVAYRKGLGVVCNKSSGFDKDDFVVEFFGEVYPPWRWYEKQDGIRALQKKEKDQAPEFYNIFLERPKRDAAGYDLLVVDAMHKANFASRLCHSCRPNCEAKVTAVDGQYMIGVYTLRPVNCGEELTFDYNSVTESKEEYNSSVCLCGNQGCRGSYLNLAGANTYQEVMRKCHGLLDRHHLLLEACTRPVVTESDWEEMKQAGLGTCLLSGLPDWAIKYAVHLVKYINMEKVKLPDELVKEKIRKRRLLGYDNLTEQERLEYDRNDAEVQTEGVYNQRLQNLAITLDKVRHVLTMLYSQPQMAPPPLKRVTGDELVKRVWRPLATDLLHLIEPHVDRDVLQSLRRRIRDHDPSTSGRVEDNLKRALIWLRDEVRKLHATVKARHDAAADVIHLYAYTEHFFTNEAYQINVSKPIKIDALDIGPRQSCSFGATYWKKLYTQEYIWGQLINWFKQTSSPEINLSKERRGCLMLPDLASCYSKELHHEFKRTYGSKQRLEMVTLMEKKRQKQWPKSLWEFKSSRGIYGSPMLDSVILGRDLNREMLHWLRTRPTVFVGPYDEQQ